MMGTKTSGYGLSIVLTNILKAKFFSVLQLQTVSIFSDSSPFRTGLLLEQIPLALIPFF